MKTTHEEPFVLPDWRTLAPCDLEALYESDQRTYWALTHLHWTDRGFIALKEQAWALGRSPQTSRERI